MDQTRKVMGNRFPFMVKYFIEDTEHNIMIIEKAIEQNNIANLVVPSHSIKSSARQLGCESLACAAKELELFARVVSDSAYQIDDKRIALQKDNAEHISMLLYELQSEYALALPLLNEMADN